MKTRHRIIIGDSRQMKEVPDESVHLIITSPPYWQLKDYGNGKQIGYNDSYEEYINNLNLVWNEYEFILIFKKYGTPPKVTKAVKEQSKLTKEEWNQYFTGHGNFAGEKQDKHLAMFPEELPGRLFKMFSFVGDTVLDPFLGNDRIYLRGGAS